MANGPSLSLLGKLALTVLVFRMTYLLLLSLLWQSYSMNVVMPGMKPETQLLKISLLPGEGSVPKPCFSLRGGGADRSAG